ncbi:MAG: hypothetical protein U1E76_24255 [Planctomycetota bacterium]
MPTSDAEALFNRWSRRSLQAAGAAALLIVIGAFTNREQLFRSYLFGFLFWLAPALGSLGIALLHDMTGGAWGFAIRRFLEAAMRTLPLNVLLFLPLLLGLDQLYLWASPAIVASDPVLQHKAPYLNVRFFTGRAASYFAAWLLLMWVLDRWTMRYEQTHDRAINRRIRTIAGPGIALYGLTMSFAAIDWAMSLEPHWSSTMYGVFFIVGQPLTTFAFTIWLAARVHHLPPFSGTRSAEQLHDLGKLLMAFVLLWAYISFAQYLIIWSANLPEETPWYLHRLHHGWQAIALLLVIFHFALPFALLLSRKLKRRAEMLGVIAGLLFLMRFVDLFWMIGPAFHQQGFAIHYLDVACPVAIGGLWLAYFLFQLKRRPLLVAREDAPVGQVDVAASH